MTAAAAAQYKRQQQAQQEYIIVLASERMRFIRSSLIFLKLIDRIKEEKCVCLFVCCCARFVSASAIDDDSLPNIRMCPLSAATDDNNSDNCHTDRRFVMIFAHTHALYIFAAAAAVVAASSCNNCHLNKQ